MRLGFMNERPELPREDDWQYKSVVTRKQGEVPRVSPGGLRKGVRQSRNHLNFATSPCFVPAIKPSVALPASWAAHYTDSQSQSWLTGSPLYDSKWPIVIRHLSPKSYG
ncbi:hypothetical protein J6590_076454 [Homalodisca vitripennis]|nr:hypothetical protein J6590_076454 [Homalodisca vitripennis]